MEHLFKIKVEGYWNDKGPTYYIRAKSIIHAAKKFKEKYNVDTIKSIKFIAYSSSIVEDNVEITNKDN